MKKLKDVVFKVFANVERYNHKVSEAEQLFENEIVPKIRNLFDTNAIWGGLSKDGKTAIIKLEAYHFISIIGRHKELNKAIRDILYVANVYKLKFISE